MKASISNYFTQLHLLVLLQMISTMCIDISEFDVSDMDNEELLNTSLEINRNEGRLPFTVSTKKDHCEHQQELDLCSDTDHITMKQ